MGELLVTSFFVAGIPLPMAADSQGLWALSPRLLPIILHPAVRAICLITLDSIVHQGKAQPRFWRQMDNQEKAWMRGPQEAVT